MRREEALRILAEHREEINVFGVRRLAVFGSVARDEAGPESDVDVLVSFDPEAHVGMFRFLELKELLEDLFGLGVDLVTEDVVKRQLRERIFGEAVDVA